MGVRNKVWMTGNLDWFAYIGDEEVWLGRREVPIPLEEGDEWVNSLGDMFRVEDGEIRLVGRGTPPEREW